MEKKKLDNLFREKFKDFSETPEEKVWRSIEAALDKKQKSRTLIPLWWKLGGVAAVLAVAIILIKPFGDDANSPTVTDADKTNNKTNGQIPLEHQDTIPKTESIVATEKKTLPENKTVRENHDGAPNVAATNRSVAGDANETSVSTVMSKNNNGADRAASSKDKNAPQPNNSDTFSNGSLSEGKTEVAAAPDTNPETTKLNPNGFDIEPEHSVPISEVTSRKQNKQHVDSLAIAHKTDSYLATNTTDKANTDEIKSNIIKDVVTETKDAFSQVNQEKTVAVTAEQQKKSIFEAIAAQEEEEAIVAENKNGKWSAGPSIAPVYFSAIGEGSPVHSTFVPNSKSGNTNLSYGLTVAYEINPKLSIRSGVHKVDYGYRTNDVQFAASSEISATGQIDNINYSTTAKNLVVVSNTSEMGVYEGFSNSDVSALSTAQNGVLSQQFGYLEVPIELEYALINSKIGVNVIGGVSSLFLTGNSISLTSGELTTTVGEANNMNNINLSANAGFGINYKFTPKVRLNIEPVFKYQLNTFSDTDGTFQPFSVGVYSGLSFRF
ncbi:MAG: outer membrane beta-barrel protein [Flavobacteriaceae bacterium]